MKRVVARVGALEIQKGVVMAKNKVLRKYAKRDLKRVMHLCDNFFYNNYLETGVLQSTEAIQKRIKYEVTKSFVKFWGTKHADKLTKRIAGTRIHFVYQTVGPVNSIDGFLVKEKTKRFNQANQTEFKHPILFKTVANQFSNPFDTLFKKHGKKLQTMLSQEEIPLDVLTCLQELNIEKDAIVQDEALANQTIKQIKELGQKFKNISYSDNPKINKDLKFLEKFAVKVETRMRKTCHRNGVDFFDAIYKNDFGLDFDPVVLTKQYDDNAKIMLRECEILGLRADNTSDVYFGAQPGDETIIHEFIHEVDDTGFENGNKEVVKSVYSDQMRQYEMFNEVVTDYMALLIKNQRQKDGRPKIGYGKDFESEYSELFSIMGKFLNAYLPELKETRLRKFPAEEFARVIGRKDFQMIAVLCNELIALKHDLDVCDASKEEGFTLNDLVADSGEFFYGSLDFFAQGMTRLEASATKQLNKSLNRALRKQSLVKVMNMFLRDQSRDLAEKWNKNEKPAFKKLSRLMWNVSEKFDSVTQKHVLKKLKAPIQSLQVKDVESMPTVSVQTEEQVNTKA